jgi:23S rRNA-/tRNA-specific pseudouridylate synthase
MALPSRARFLVTPQLVGGAPGGLRLDKLLPAAFPGVSRRAWREALACGAVKRNADTTRVAGKLVLPGDVLELHLGRLREVLAKAGPSGSEGGGGGGGGGGVVTPTPPGAAVDAPPRILSPDALTSQQLDALVREAAGMPEVDDDDAVPAASVPGPDRGSSSTTSFPYVLPQVARGPPPLDVLHCDSRFLVVNKPGGMLCQAAESRETRVAREGGGRGSGAVQPAQPPSGNAPAAPAAAIPPLAALSYGTMPLCDLVPWWLAHRAGTLNSAGASGAGFCHLYHRLDRVASGSVLFVRSRALLPHLDEAWDAGGVQRTYVAVVQGVPAWRTRVSRAPIGRAPGTSAWKFTESPAGKPARTAFRVVATGPDYAVVEAEPQTGRTHQIRVHLAALGHPIVGDVLYGASPRRWPLSLLPPRAQRDGDVSSGNASEGGYSHRILLHAARLAFLQPVRHAQLAVDAPLPPDVASYVAAATPLAEGGGGGAYELPPPSPREPLPPQPFRFDGEQR